MSLIILWNNSADNWLKRRLRAVGRMALTNYLTQTILGVLVLTMLLGDVSGVNRAAILLLRLLSLDTASLVVAGVAQPIPVRSR